METGHSASHATDLAPYEIGLAVVGQRVVLLFRREGRQRVVTLETSAPHAHAAAVEGVRRALAEPLRHPAPRVIYLRQKSVVVGQDFTPVEIAAVPGGARLVWSSAKSPDGEDALVAQAACLAMAPSDRSGRGPEAGR